MGYELDVPADGQLERPVRLHILLQTLQRLLRARMLPAPGAGRDVTLTLHEDTIWEPDLSLDQSSDSSVGHILDELTSERGTRRALVVEDNATNVRLMREFLSQLGWEATIAETGERALELVGDAPWDLILMDCQLPGIDGYTTARRIREMEPRLGIRHTIYALTAHAMRGERERVLEAGMDDFLTKPISLATLRDALDRARPARMPVTRAASSIRAAAALSAAALSPAAPAVEVVDRARWETLLRDCGDVGFVASLVDDFAQDAEAHIASMLTDPRPANLRERAHALRGAAAQFGLSALCALCLRMEQAPDSAAGLAPQLRVASLDGVAALRALVAG
jgi:CheY-like chemotaxis protein